MEREIFDPYDTGPDLAFYGRTAPQASPAASSGGGGYTAGNPPPAGSAPPGTQWMLNPTTGQFEPVPIGQMPSWGPIASAPGSPTPTASPTPVAGGDPYGAWNPSPTRPGAFDPYTAYGRDLSQMLPFPAYQSAPGLNFDPFSPSSWEDAENEPGYKASRVQLRKQIEAGAAHGGMLRSGMTIGDLYTNLDALGQQNFKQFDDRRFRNWAGNRDLAVAQHRTVADDIDRGNNYRFNVADRSAQDALARWKTVTDGLVNLSRPVD